MKSLNTSATIDPVCGMSVDPDRATAAYEYHRHTYFFCSHGCLEKFKSDPKVYISPQSAQLFFFNDTATTEIYTCPMHPEVRQKGPGSCPKCGMALEPEI